MWEGCEYWLQKTPEVNLWKLMTKGKDELPECCRHLIVYVDDLLVVAPSKVRLGFLDRLQKEWNTSAPESVGTNGWTRFAGVELRWNQNGGLRINQHSYTKELLERHQVTIPRWSPMSKVDLPEESEPGVTTELIRRAQALTGELLWLSVRIRPDIGYAVSQMGRAVSKNPTWSLEIGQSILGFLAATPNHGLTYYPCQEDRGITQIPIQRHEKLVEVYSDVSFAPGGKE